MLRSAVRFVVCGAALLCAFTLVRVAPMSAQGATADSAVLQALLVEVRLLRIAVEGAASVGPRVQVAGERVQQLEHTVADLKQKLGEARSYNRQMQSVDSPLHGDADQQARGAAHEGEISASLSEAEAELADMKKVLNSLLALPDASGKVR